MWYITPTPIQSAVIPAALAGNDICANACTGSGKTAAFLLPVAQRLLQMTRGVIRAVIVSPTRELTAQSLSMMVAVGNFAPLRCSLIVGGAKNVNKQVSCS